MADDGSFVVVWADYMPLRGQRFDAAANPVGSELTLSAGSALLPSIAHRPAGGYVVIWDPIVGHRFDDTMTPVGDYFLVSEQINTSNPRLAANNGRQTVFVWTSIGQPPDSASGGIFSRRGGFPDWAPFTADERASAGTSNVNGVIETGERVVVDPAYLNLSGLPYPLAGTASNFTGPAGPVYTIHDASADYGAISGSAPVPSNPSGSTTANCFTATANCFEFGVTGARPQPHWDATYDETLSEGVLMTRKLHIGGSFADVPGSSVFSKFIENLFHNGVTAGGPCGGYCPTDGVKRQQMAVFLLKSKYGSAYVPPSPTGTVFNDVPQSNPFAAWIEDLSNRGITGGCQVTPPLFCPDAIVNRQQMAVFLLKTEEGSAYDPPDCAQIFQDVLCTPGIGFSDFIEELYNRQITGGCVAVPLQYCPTNPTNRQQMAAFLVKTFGLLLYGP